MIKNLTDLKQRIQYLKEKIQNITNEFPTENDFLGAQKGLLTLFYTYHFDIPKTIFNGTLAYFDHTGQKRRFNCHEKMNVYDYEKLMNLAIERQNYAGAIYVLQDIFLALKSMKKFEDHKFLKKIELARSNLIKLNNGYLEKSQTFLSK